MIHRLMNGWHEKERLLAEKFRILFQKELFACFCL